MEESGLFRRIFKGLCGVNIILFLFLYNINTNPQSSSLYYINSNSGDALITTNTNNSESLSCVGLRKHEGFDNRCEFLKVHSQCRSGGFFHYLRFFYCNCYTIPVLGYIVLALWLAALFYLLGNTAADYFCCSLENLSRILNLPPTLAGVSLLPLGNGAPDVFASIAAFVDSDAADVGFNSVLGASVFVTCVVLGAVSLLVADKHVHIDRTCFIRDVSFFFIAILALFFILLLGEITVGAAISFLLIYVLYASVVAVNEMFKKEDSDSFAPMLPVNGGLMPPTIHDNTAYSSLLEFDPSDQTDHLPTSVHPTAHSTHLVWASSLAIYSNVSKTSLGSDTPPWGWNDEDREPEKSFFSCPKLFSVLELPLTVPRRLTIPMVEEQTWSKLYAIASASLAPILLVFLWSSEDDPNPLSKEIVYLISLIGGCVLGFLAYRYTISDHPPRRFLFPWVLGGFIMSIVWFYIIASELVALLVAFGIILGIKPSILGLTVLAWGNSMGDLVSNVAIALNGGDGVQIALSGCYAGPMFNTLIGLGLSLLIGASSASPNALVIPKDNTLFFTIGALLAGLMWAVVVLLCKDMRPSRTLGVGLISIYLVFLTFRIVHAVNTDS